MSVKRDRPGKSEVRKSAFVGPDYDEAKFRSPWGTDTEIGNEEDRTVCSPAGSTFDGGDQPINKDYNSYWGEK